MIETLAQVNPQPGTFVPPIQATIPMKDQNGKAVSVFASYDNGGANILRFDDWGNSYVSIDSWTQSGNYNGLPTHFHVTFHGVGNITGNGNDDAYTGTLDVDLTYGYSEGLHKYECVFKNGSASISYTD